MKRPLCVTGFSMLFALFLLCKANPKAIGAVCLAALIAFVVSLFIKSVRRDKTLPTAFLSIAVAGVLLLSAGAQNAALSAYTEAKACMSRGAFRICPTVKTGGIITFCARLVSAKMKRPKSPSGFKCTAGFNPARHILRGRAHVPFGRQRARR